MSHSESIDQLATALAAAQGMMKAAAFNRVNPHFKNKYADLAAVIDAIREPLSKNGLAFTQTMERVLIGDANGTEQFLRTTLHHASGQWIDSYYPLPTIGDKLLVAVKDRNGDPQQVEVTIGPQQLGSALTYARRYSLSAIIGIASDEDDDANEASKADVAPRKPEVTSITKLTEAQREDIEFYLKELTPTKVKAFLVWLNVKAVDDIGQHQYDRAIAGLKKAVGSDLGGGVGGAGKPQPDRKGPAVGPQETENPSG